MRLSLLSDFLSFEKKWFLTLLSVLRERGGTCRGRGDCWWSPIYCLADHAARTVFFPIRATNLSDWGMDRGGCCSWFDEMLTARDIASLSALKNHSRERVVTQWGSICWALCFSRGILGPGLPPRPMDASNSLFCSFFRLLRKDYRAGKEESCKGVQRKWKRNARKIPKGLRVYRESEKRGKGVFWVWDWG